MIKNVIKKTYFAIQRIKMQIHNFLKTILLFLRRIICEIDNYTILEMIWPVVKKTHRAGYKAWNFKSSNKLLYNNNFISYESWISYKNNILTPNLLRKWVVCMDDLFTRILYLVNNEVIDLNR